MGCVQAYVDPEARHGRRRTLAKRSRASRARKGVSQLTTRGNALLADITSGRPSGLSSIRHIYFPVDCLVSLLLPQTSHRSLEVAMVGNEGLVGVPLVLGIRTSLVQAVVQASGSAWRMTARDFHQELPRQSALRKDIDHYIHALIAQLTRSAACNAFHPVEARCARWLLMARDRMQADELELTQDALSQMLGVRRVGITVAAGNLQRIGAIRYSRGRILILDAQRLADAACECYGEVENTRSHNRTAQHPRRTRRENH
jgi:CRP-like cAMP-binding protein